MRTILSIGAAAALMASVSNASADDCVAGFRMIKGNIPVPCDGYYAAPEAPVYVAPRYERRGHYPRYYDGPVYRTDIYEGSFLSWRTYRQPYYGPGYLGSYYHPRYAGSRYAAGPYPYPGVGFGFGFGFGWDD